MPPKFSNYVLSLSAMWRDVRLEIRYRRHGITHRSRLEGSIRPRRVTKYQPMTRNAPEERRPQLHRDVSLQSLNLLSSLDPVISNLTETG